MICLNDKIHVFDKLHSDMRYTVVDLEFSVNQSALYIKKKKASLNRKIH